MDGVTMAILLVISFAAVLTCLIHCYGMGYRDGFVEGRMQARTEHLMDAYRRMARRSEGDGDEG